MKKRAITFYSFLPLNITSIAVVSVLGGFGQVGSLVLISLVANFVIAVVSMVLALLFSGNKTFVTLKKIALFSILLVIIGDIYSLFASIYLNAEQFAISSPFLSEYFAPRYYNSVTQFFGVILINLILLSLLFKRTQLKYKFLIILTVSLINSPWMLILQQQSNYASYTDNQLADVSEKNVTAFKEKIEFEEKGVELRSLPEIEKTYKTLVATFEVTVPQSGIYWLNMSIHRQSESDSPEAIMFEQSSAGDPHDTYYVNDKKTDWFEAPHEIELQQGKNTVVVKIPFVYTDAQSGELKYNLLPNRANNSTFGSYILKFDINEFEGENGSIDLGESKSPDGIKYFEYYPSLSIHTLSYRLDEIINN